MGSDLVLLSQESLADDVPVVEGDLSDLVDELLLLIGNFSLSVAVHMVVEEHDVLPHIPLTVGDDQQLGDIIDGII